MFTLKQLEEIQNGTPAGKALIAKAIEREHDLDRRCWEIVDEIGWSTEDGMTDYDVARAMLLDKYSKGRMKDFEEWFSRRRRDLYDACDEVAEGFSDDSYGDALAECIGRGKRFYESIMKNPKKINELKFRESFAYCIPTDEDYELREPHGMLAQIGTRVVRESDHYNPANWDNTGRGGLVGDDPGMAPAVRFYEGLVAIWNDSGLYSDPVYQVVVLLDEIGSEELENAYKLAYRKGKYGFGNLIRDFQRKLPKFNRAA